jgi:catechol 2,3-dioxygenase-like lactoylglutathione lyase family enzyme
MNQRLTFITLGVSDLEKAKEFYVNVFGWKPIKDDQGIVFFKLNGLILSLFPNEELAKDAGVPNDGTGFKRMTLAINFKSEQEVDVAFAEAVGKGAKSVVKPEKVFVFVNLLLKKNVIVIAARALL